MRLIAGCCWAGCPCDLSQAAGVDRTVDEHVWDVHELKSGLAFLLLPS
jgi:hypothetical protein